MTAGQSSATRVTSRWSEFTVEALVRIAGLSTIGFVLLIFLFLLREGVPFFLTVPLENLLSTAWYPTFDKFGTLPLVLGSLSSRSRHRCPTAWRRCWPASAT